MMRLDVRQRREEGQDLQRALREQERACEIVEDVLEEGRRSLRAEL